MPRNSFDQFRRTLMDDASLRSELSELVDADAFIKRVVELGSARGFDVDPEDVRQALVEGRDAWIKQRT
jgi:hypothetical protein